jgi:hypothetical protein
MASLGLRLYFERRAASPWAWISGGVNWVVERVDWNLGENYVGEERY